MQANLATTALDGLVLFALLVDIAGVPPRSWGVPVVIES